MTSDIPETVSPLAYYRAAHRNVLSDALPKLDFDDSIFDKISFLPPQPDDDVRSQTASERMAYLGELSRIHIALNRDRDLAQAIDGMIREGYLARGSVANQRAAATERKEQLVAAASEATKQKAALEQLLARAQNVHTATPTWALFGISGAGKSRTVHQVGNLYPRTIPYPAVTDPRLPTLQIPVLIVEAPADRTIPSFHAAVMREIIAKTEEDLPQKLKGGNRSERIGTIADLLQSYHVGILIIDEIQKLIRSNGKPDYILLNFILEIANTLRVPVLFVGTPAAQTLLAGELRNARRMLGRPWANYTKNSVEWTRLIDMLWPYQFTAEFAPLNDELRAVIHHETIGLPGLLVRLFRETQRVLVLANQQGAKKIPERIDVNIIRAVASAIFAPVRLMLEALRGGKPEEIACFEDLALNDETIEERVKELAAFRQREFYKTVRSIRREGTKQRRRSKMAIRQEVDALLGPVKAAEAIGVAVAN